MPNGAVYSAESMAKMIIDRIGSIGCKSVLRLTGRAVATAGPDIKDKGEAQLAALEAILDDLAGDEVTSEKLCEVI